MDFLWGNVIKTTQGHYAFPAIALNRGGSLLLQIDNNLQLKSIFEFQTPDDYTAIDEDMVELSDGGFMILGRVQRPNLKHDGFVRRIDKHGNLLWFNYYGDYNKDETFRCVVKVTDNRFVIGGGAGPNNNDPFGLRAGLWAIDSNGVVLDTWVGPNEPNLILLRGLLPTPDGGFIANGRTYWGEGDWGSMVQVSLMKFDSALQLQWLQHVGPNNSGYNGIYDMVSTPDGHYIVAGERTAYGDLSLPSDDWGGWLYKFSEQGDSIWSRADNAPPGYDATGEFVYGGVGVLSSGSIVAGGKGDIDDKFVGWVVKVTADGCMDTLFCYTSGSEEPAWETGLRVFPNPATTFAQLDFKTSMPANSQVAVHDLAGRRVLMEDLPEGSISHTLHCRFY
ncbi:MAG: hypothetical protein IPH31_00305 [Lewinellaceae bacterium]|nr:hypothetical protein [Lewinellaceae bacterium]